MTGHVMGRVNGHLADHRGHIRTTNLVDSTFRQFVGRIGKTKADCIAKTFTTMMFRLVQSMSKNGRTFRDHQHIRNVIQGVKFVDGVNENHSTDDELTHSETGTIQAEIVA
jgi:hypothetical protein